MKKIEKIREKTVKTNARVKRKIASTCKDRRLTSNYCGLWKKYKVKAAVVIMEIKIIRDRFAYH